MAASRKKRSTSKNTARSKTASKQRKQGNAKAKGNGQTGFLKEEILVLLSVAVSILLLLSVFGVGGTVLQTVQKWIFGVFGFMAYFVPFLLFFGTIFWISNRENFKVKLKVITAFFMAFLLCCVIQLLTENFDPLMKISDYYLISVESKRGGGAIGGIIAKGMYPLFGKIGTFVILISLLLIGAVIVTERSLIGGIKKGSRKAYEAAKEDVAKYKESQAVKVQRREENEKARVNKKANGVALNTELKRPGGIKDEIRELKEEEDVPVLEEESLTGEMIPGEMEELTAEGNRVRGRKIRNSRREKEKLKNADEGRGSLEESDEISDTSFPDASDVPDTPGESNASAASDIEKTLERAFHEMAEEERQKEEKKKEEEKREEKVLSGEEYCFPPLTLLTFPEGRKTGKRENSVKETAHKLEQTLQNFGVGVTVTNVSQGPSVTRYELQPEQGVKVSRIVGLSDDIKLNLAAADIRIEAPIPGKAAIGIEVPNKENSTVRLRELLESEEFKKYPSKLAFAVGKDIGGQVIVADIARMPHLLIAGATGSGKSVCINTLIMSIIYKATPKEVKLIMIDPKVVELSVYNGIPHLMIPVVTDPKKAAGALNWAVAEMSDRYKKFADLNVRDLKGYNAKIETIDMIEDENKPEKLPQIVIIVDELADLMMVAPGEVEESICRLAQLARAAGIHLVIATQRPSVNVITGLIKANVPSRIAFSVSSGVDSRTIIDMNGAEKLLGKGDMLFYPSGYQKPVRVQGAFVSDTEVMGVVDYLIKQGHTAEYNEAIEQKMDAVMSEREVSSQAAERDAYFVDAGKFIIEKDKASIGMLQRMFKIGFNRAARIMDQLAEAGVVGEEEGTKPRKVLMSMEEFEEFIEEQV